MPDLIEVSREMFAEIHPLLKEFDGPQSDWRRLFEREWRGGQGRIGYALRDKDEVVGFLGTVFSERLINGRSEKFCNLSSWIVREPYRRFSLQLLVPVLRLTDHTVTNLSPAPAVHAVLRRVGFQILETHWTVLPTVSSLGHIQLPRVSMVSSDPEVVSWMLDGEDHAVFRDHLPYECEHAAVLAAGRTCHVIFARRAFRRGPIAIPYAHVHHISDHDLFWSNFESFRKELLLRHRLPMMVLDSRWVGDRKFRLRKDRQRPQSSLFRSKRLSRDQIDNLYSELILLNF